MPIVLTPAPNSRAFSELVYLVAPYVTGCPPPQIKTALRQAAKELCRDGWVWQADLDPISVVALQDEYAITAPSSDGDVYTIIQARLSGRTLEFRAWSDLRAMFPAHPDTASPGEAYLWSMSQPDTMSLYPVPETSVASGLLLRAVLVPTTDAAGIDERVSIDYEEELVWGALWRLMVMPEKPWSNIKLADFYGRKFKNSISLARARPNKGLTAYSVGVKFPRVM